MNSTNSSVDGSLNITRNSWRMIAVLTRHDISDLRGVLAVAAAGQGEIHALQAGVDDLQRLQPRRVRASGSQRRGSGPPRIRGLQAHRRSLDDRPVADQGVGNRPVEDHL